MAEIKTPPSTWEDQEGTIYEGFGPSHTLADIARWLMTNPVEAEEVRDLLTKMLESK